MTLLLELKTKDQRIDELEKFARRRDDSYADQVSNLLKDTSRIENELLKTTSVAQTTTYGIQTALLASTKQYHTLPPPIGEFGRLNRQKYSCLMRSRRNSLRLNIQKTLAAHEKRIRVLEDALCGAQAANLSDSQCHRHSLAAMINWALVLENLRRIYLLLSRRYFEQTLLEEIRHLYFW